MHKLSVHSITGNNTDRLSTHRHSKNSIIEFSPNTSLNKLSKKSITGFQRYSIKSGLRVSLRPKERDSIFEAINDFYQEEVKVKRKNFMRTASSDNV